MQADVVRERPDLPEGERVYVVGEVHGCFDLLARLISCIRMDSDNRPQRSTKLVFLGGLINRGSQSADVVTRVSDLTQKSDKLVVLQGLDERMLLQSMAGDLDLFEAFLCRGGDATLRSWGIDATTIDGPLSSLLEASRKAIGPKVLDWLSGLPLFYRFNGYLFVHAGIHPSGLLDPQREKDLLWIGEDFGELAAAHEAVIVHGHAKPGEAAELLPHRIGLACGAWWSDMFSAVGLEDDQRWVVTA